MTVTTTAQYESMIDAQTWDFIEKTDQWYPPETIDFSLERQRQIYNNLCREFHHGYPNGIDAVDDTIDTNEYSIPVRRYTNNRPDQSAMILYFHGGGFVVGGLESHDDVCAELCDSTGLNVTAVDYRLAPEHLHPAAFNDSLASTIHEYHRTTQPVILCGDSAGGNLAAAVSHALRDTAQVKVKVAGQVLVYPALGGDTQQGSYLLHANAPMLTARDVHFYSTIRTGYKEVANPVSLAPLKDTNFQNLPATVAFSAECDPLADDARQYTQAIEDAGGQARWINEEGLVHGYLRARHTVDRARNSFARIVDAITQMASSVKTKAH